ncbi:MAG: hypothetical protein U1F98_05025 [Verrucomicrobiota bacterium]
MNIQSNSRRFPGLLPGCVAACLLLLGAGCASMSSSAPDSLDNPTTNTWTVSATFASGKHDTFDMAPESMHQFAAQQQVTYLSAVSKGARPVTHALSTRDLQRLRQSAPGELMLVVYEDGLTALSPNIKRNIERVLSQEDYNRGEYFRLLRLEDQAAMLWKQQVTGSK